MLSIAITSYLLAVAVADNLKDTLKSIGKDAKTITKKPKILKRILNFTQTHSNVKQLSNFCV